MGFQGKKVRQIGQSGKARRQVKSVGDGSSAVSLVDHPQGRKGIGGKQGRLVLAQTLGKCGRQRSGVAGTYFFDSEPAQVDELEGIIFAGYLAGLRHAGWAAVMLDPASDVNVAAMYGRSAEEVLAGWVTLAEFLLDRADEARQLMAKL